MKMNFTAPCIFGLESLVSDELKKMGAETSPPKTEECSFRETNIWQRAQISAQDFPNV